MKIIATIEVPLGSFDEENPSHSRALTKLMNSPQEMIERIYNAIDDGWGFGIHSPRIEEEDI